MIRSFRSRDTEALFRDRDVRRFRAFERTARRKLLLLHRAASLQDLRVSPGNRLEELKGDRRGPHSIRINDQWRLCRPVLKRTVAAHSQIRESSGTYRVARRTKAVRIPRQGLHSTG